MCRERLFVFLILLAGLARAATFGDVTPIAGQAADIALDEGRGVLYVANFTAGRVDVLLLSDRRIHTSIHVPPGPSSLALSRDGAFLVVTHFGNALPPASAGNALTIIDLAGGSRQTFTLDSPPLGSAFGADRMALIATTTNLLRLDPASGRTEIIDTVAGVTATSIPAPPATPPVQIVAAALAASGDGRWIFGLTDTIRFSYDVANRRIRSLGYTATPPLGPRVVTVARDGSYYAAGWAVFDRGGPLLAQVGNASGALGVGSLALDSAAGILYAQVPQGGTAAGGPPVLSILDADNLTTRDRLYLPENLAGRALLNAAADTLYAVSESGVMVLPVGSLASAPRLAADREDLVFEGNLCQRGAITRSLQIVDPGGGQTSFSASTDLDGVRISASSGRTPATLQVLIDPAAFQDRRGTVTGTLTISSTDAVNPPVTVRLLINNRRPDDRGSSTNVPGKLADLLADPGRDRFYVLRQDRNQVLVFDGSGLFQIAALRTGTTPTRMAITFDQKYLLIGHDNSQLIYVYDLDSLQQLPPVALPPGHYPRSIAASSNAILVASRVSGGVNTIDRIDLLTRTATTLPSLGVFQNMINVDTVLTATPNGSAIAALSADGNVLLYDAGADTFIVSRKLSTAISGAFAASASGQFAAGNTLLNSSLVRLGTVDASGFPSGFAFVDSQGLSLAGPQTAAGAGGTIERVDLATGAGIRPTRVTEQPLIAGGYSGFTRTLAPLANRNTVIALTVSGFTAIAWNFDAATVPPSISSVVNAADLTSKIAPGSLISVFGSNLNPTNAATKEIPLPTAIRESCLTANGVPVPMMFASLAQINAQLPLHLWGQVTMTLYTPGGVSDDYYLSVVPAAPAVFQSGTAGPLTGIPVVIKAGNQQLVTPSNPIHSNDEFSIYATGLGSTSPEVEAGVPPPDSPPALSVVAPEVQLAGVPLTVSYAGLVPGQPGVFRIDVRAPNHAQSGMNVPLTISQTGATASIIVRVVE